MNMTKLAEGIAIRLKNMTPAERFRFFCSWYGGLDYMGGKENFVYGADCSGTVCGPLYLMGYDIRCTANDLFREIFTDKVVDHDDAGEIVAAFFITKEACEHFGAIVPAGYVTHVAPMIGRYVVQNAFNPIRPMPSKYVYEWYSSHGKSCVWRQLNWESLVRHHEAHDLLYGLDPVLQAMR
jgi:hypothetical protein